MTTTSPLARHRGLRRVLTSLATVFAAGVAFVGLPAATASAVTIPLAPSNLVVGPTGSSSFAVVWADNSSDETGFEIERCANTSTLDPSGNLVLGGCTTSTAFSLRATAAANATSYIDGAFGTFTYRVRAVNSAGASGWTASVHSQTIGVPTAVIAPVSAATATVAVAFDGAGSSALIGSLVTHEWSFGDGATALGATVSHTYAAAGTYSVMLTVTDTQGNASYARTTVTVGPAPYVPVAPSGVTATSTVKQRVDLKWSGAGTAGATSFLVYRCSGSSCTRFTLVATLLTGQTTYTDTTVRSGTTYRYYVAALYSTVTLASKVVTVKAR